jgi:hypothetical protein
MVIGWWVYVLNRIQLGKRHAWVRGEDVQPQTQNTEPRAHLHLGHPGHGAWSSSRTWADGMRPNSPGMKHGAPDVRGSGACKERRPPSRSTRTLTYPCRGMRRTKTPGVEHGEHGAADVLRFGACKELRPRARSMVPRTCLHLGTQRTKTLGMEHGPPDVPGPGACKK